MEGQKEGNIVFGGFGPPITNPIVWITIHNGRGYLNAHISDADGDLVLSIHESVITLNRENIYNVQSIPPNQIPPDRLIVTNQYGETALDLRNENDEIILNADFHEGNLHVVATDEGTSINPHNPTSIIKCL